MDCSFSRIRKIWPHKHSSQNWDVVTARDQKARLSDLNFGELFHYFDQFHHHHIIFVCWGSFPTWSRATEGSTQFSSKVWSARWEQRLAALDFFDSITVPRQKVTVENAIPLIFSFEKTTEVKNADSANQFSRDFVERRVSSNLLTRTRKKSSHASISSTLVGSSRRVPSRTEPTFFVRSDLNPSLDFWDKSAFMLFCFGVKIMNDEPFFNDILSIHSHGSVEMMISDMDLVSWGLGPKEAELHCN